ncbi:coiled-coil domain-containing protein [Nakamurella leprariae]|uniref:DivIVA domain-containing protein n=1 Tax=Nakamurella leprariae TaxID=2803911 RepID=A0A939BVT7_9ACTN|nr:hypothetical protein [Nakamurella leprariae]MBM9466853.1 hypothetical protein [Nakamurella leprariae]
MSSNEWMPAQAPFDIVRRGFDPEQVTAHLERLEYDLRIATANRDATNQRLTELTDQLSSVQAESDGLRAELDRLALEPVSMTGLSDRMQRMIRIAEEEAAEIRARAVADADQLRSELTAAVAAQRAERETFDDERERTRRQLADQVRDLLAEAGTEAEATRAQARREAETSVATATAEADRTLADARGKAQRAVTAARNEADQTLAAARAEAEQTLTAARTEAEQTRVAADRMLAEARSEAETTVQAARAEAEATLTAARAEAASLNASSAAERDRLDAESAARRAQVEEDFEIASQARRAEFHQRLTEREQLSIADAEHRIASADQQARTLVADATEQSAELVRRATAQARQRVAEADDAVRRLTDLRGAVLGQMEVLREHLAGVDAQVASAPALVAPPAAEVGRPVTDDFPEDPAARPTGYPADFAEQPLPLGDQPFAQDARPDDLGDAAVPAVPADGDELVPGDPIAGPDDRPADPAAGTGDTHRIDAGAPAQPLPEQDEHRGWSFTGRRR